MWGYHKGFWGAFSANLGEMNILHAENMAIMIMLEEENRKG